MKRSFWIIRSSDSFSYSVYIIAICFCLGLNTHVKADWLSVCDNSYKPAQASFQKKYFKPNGDMYWLSLTSNVSREVTGNCDIKEIPNLSYKPLWIDLISQDLANALGSRVILQGVQDKGQIKISEIIPQQTLPNNKDLNRLIPINVNQINNLSYRVFGVEERVSIQKKSSHLIVQCKKGTKPAGVLLSLPSVKLKKHLALNLSLNYRADAGMQVGIADQTRFDKGAPIILGALSPSMNLQRQLFSVPEKINRNSSTHLSVICPRDASVLQIADLKYIPKRTVKDSIKRSMWFWKPALWQEKSTELLLQAEKYRAGRVFISIDLDENNKTIKQALALVEFIKKANAKQIEVWVVEGDPRVVLPKDRVRFVERNRIYSKFNASQPQDLQLKGIQYDIEPYLISGYAIEVERWVQAYVDTIAQLHHVSTMPLEIVIPFWWESQMLGGKLLLDQLVPYVEGVNVMNYRTSQELLEQFAQPILE